MQTVQAFEDPGPGHAPRRTNTRYISEAFNFLDKDEYSNTDEQSEGLTGIYQAKSEPILSEPLGDLKRDSVSNGDLRTNGEFRIETSVERSPVKIDKEDNIFQRYSESKDIRQIHKKNEDEYTIITYADGEYNDKRRDVQSLPLNFNAVYIVDDNDNNSKFTENSFSSKPDNQTRVNRDIDDTQVNKSVKESVERDSGIIDGEEVEFRNNSPGQNGLTRKSRLPTWRTNQAVVSEAFGFLKEIGDTEDLDLVQYEGIENDNVNGIDGSHSKLDDSNGNSGDNNIQDKEKSHSKSELSADSSSHNVSDASIGENDDVGEMVGGQIRQRRKPKPHSDNGEDDGGSSDEDTGVYRESFRKSTWLYIGDNEQIKGANPADYVALADLGVDTCAEDDIFGDIPPPPATPKTPLSSHKRNNSVDTTASEAEFKQQYNSVRTRFVKRADSHQEYKRFTAHSYDQVQLYVIQKEPGEGYGIHLLDSKPVIVSKVDEGSPAESAGVKEGQILSSINGENVLEFDQQDIIKLVQQYTTEIKLELGSGDVSRVIDLQQPVITGYLQKQTSSTIFRVWKKRFFILRRDNCLYYYKTNQALTRECDPLGAIPLNGYSVSRYGEANKFGFKAEKYGCRTFFFLAENRDDMTKWVGCLNEAAERGNEKKDAWMDVTTQNVGLPALEIRKPDCSGYLNKQGRATKRWRKRYCVLKDACIYYYKNTNSKEADGVAHLHGYRVEPKGLSGKKCSFCLIPPEDQMRTFAFYTDNETDKERWINALYASIGKWVRVES